MENPPDQPMQKAEITSFQRSQSSKDFENLLKNKRRCDKINRYFKSKEDEK